MNRPNYQREMEALIAAGGGKKRRLLLHVCCAPCSSYVLEALREDFDITLFFSNHNMNSAAEFAKREGELRRLVAEMDLPFPVITDPYRPEIFFNAVRGLESLGERSLRCEACFRMRLEAAAQAAKDGDFDFFTTTLTISPLKDAEALNRIGTELGNACGVAFLPSDFKKKGGYKRSIQLSRQYDLYRQNYCGCCFSKAEAAARCDPASH